MVEDYLQKVLQFKAEALNILGIENQEKSHKSKYKIGIITSTLDELNAVKEILTTIKEIDSSNNSLICFTGIINSKSGETEVLVSVAIEMGIEASIILTTKLLDKYSFEYLFMLGVAAGNKNVVKIGDILFVEQTLNYNQVSVTEKKDKTIQKKFMQNQISIDRTLKTKIKRLNTSNVIEYIKNQCKNNKQDLENLSIKSGLIVTGSTLLRSSQKIAEINADYLNVIGFDMESSGFYYAISNVDKNDRPYFLSIKSVSDYGDTTSHKFSPKQRKDLALSTMKFAFFYFINNFI